MLVRAQAGADHDSGKTDDVKNSGIQVQRSATHVAPIIIIIVC